MYNVTSHTLLQTFKKTPIQYTSDYDIKNTLE